MLRRLFLLTAAAMLAMPMAASAQTPAVAKALTAQATVAAAAKDADKSGRKLLVVFHASWCVYCRAFDLTLKDEKVRATYEKHFVVLHVRALERDKAMQAKQLAGVDKLFVSYAKDGAGLPFYAAVDGAGKKVADSFMKDGANTGFPVTPEELIAFDAMLAKAAPKMTAAEIKLIHDANVKMAKKQDL